MDPISIREKFGDDRPRSRFSFQDSNMRPPADTALNTIRELTSNTAIVLPPSIKVQELDGLPVHEREKIYLGKRHELFCLYFGELMAAVGETEFRVTQ